jgi:hypothetical protein
MLLSSLTAEGLRRPVHHVAHGAPLVDVPGGADGVAAGDALELAFLALGGPNLDDRLRALGLVTAPEVTVTHTAARPAQIRGLDPHGVRALTAPATGRVGPSVTIQIELVPDPILAGQLWQMATRDPRIAAGVGEGTLSFRIGWLFTRGGDVASVDVLRVGFGDVSISTASDRPTWFEELCASVASRFHRQRFDGGPAIAWRLWSAATSDDPARRAHAAALAAAAAEAPFHLGRVELVHDGSSYQPCFGAELLRYDRAGRWAADALSLLDAALLRRPELLFVEQPGATAPDAAAVRAWLEALTNDDASPLRQVWSC